MKLLPKPQYVKLRRLCKEMFKREEAEYGYAYFDECRVNGILMFNTDIRVSYDNFQEVLRTIAEDLGLEDDGTGTNTYTRKKE